MKTAVKLQDPFSYSGMLLLILIIIVITPLVIFCIIKLIKLLAGRQKKVKKVAKPKRAKTVDKDLLRKNSLKMVASIEEKYKNNQIDWREAFIQLSYVVREFVQKATGIRASNLSLSEIEELSMPSLYELIKSFYAPEFSAISESVGPENPFEDARKVIKEWN